MKHPNVHFSEQTIANQTLPFNLLELPAELRIEILEYVLADGYGSINKILDRYVQQLMRSGTGIVLAQFDNIKLHTPPILLANKQIYRNARMILDRKPLVINHGLLLFKLTQFISAPTLRNIQHIILSDSGHDPLDANLPRSFIGHLHLNMAMANWLSAPGHRLLSLKLDYCSPTLQKHVEECWIGQPQCDIRVWLEQIVNSWREVRTLNHLKINGWMPETMQKELQNSLTSAYCPLLFLSHDVRRHIYHACIDLDSVSRTINAYNNPNLKVDKETSITCAAPSVLFLSRRLTPEITSYLANEPLIIDLIFPPRPTTTLRDLTMYISPFLLRKIQHIRIILRHRAWLSMLGNLSEILAGKHALLSFHLHFVDDRMKSRKTVSLDGKLEVALTPLHKIYGVKHVSFGGDLANAGLCDALFLNNLQSIMTSKSGHAYIAGDVTRSRKRKRT